MGSLGEQTWTEPGNGGSEHLIGYLVGREVKGRLGAQGGPRLEIVSSVHRTEEPGLTD